jgi:hypothetical protein
MGPRSRNDGSKVLAGASSTSRRLEDKYRSKQTDGQEVREKSLAGQFEVMHSEQCELRAT